MKTRKLAPFLLMLLLSLVVFADESQQEVQEPKKDPIASALSGMSLIEQYCSGVATLDYAIDGLRDGGAGKIDTAKTIINQLIEKFPNEDPVSLKYIVATLTHDVYKYRSLQIDTLVAYHFYSCIEGISTGKGFVYGDQRLSEKLIDVVSCEAPGVNVYSCLMSVYGFDIPEEVLKGEAR